MIIELSRMHHPVTVLGYGSRVGIWVQGCSIRCPDCLSRDTWDRDIDSAVEIDQLVSWIATLDPESIDGVTISGGEPFDQPEALYVLVQQLHDLRGRRSRVTDLLCYSGYSLGRLRREFGEIVDQLDVVISEPYIAARGGHLPLRGSANQRITPLTALGRQRYREQLGTDASRNRFQIEADGEAIWYIGIPGPGDMLRLEELMQAQGVYQRQASWRS